MNDFLRPSGELEDVSAAQVDSMLRGAYDHIRHLDERTYDDLPSLDSIAQGREADFVQQFGDRIIKAEDGDAYVLREDVNIDQLADDLEKFLTKKDEK